MTPIRRKVHETEFRGAPFWMRIPTKEEEIRAQIKAARYLNDETERDLNLDPEVWSVDTVGVFLLSYACCSEDGTDRYTPGMMMSQFTADEHLELLHRLKAFRLIESKNPPVIDEETCQILAERLALTESSAEAFDICAGFDHVTMVLVARGISQLL